jgi:ferrous iron transport protein A
MSRDFGIVPLAALRPGSTAQVVGVQGRGVALRLARLGIRPGARVRLVSHGPFAGPLLVEVEGLRVALGRGVARRVMVQPII